MQTELPTPTGDTDNGSPAGSDPRGQTTKRLIAAAVLTVLAVGVTLAVTGGDDDAVVTTGEALQLSLGEGDSMASCLPVDAAILADMSPAFAATATAVEGETVTLAVDRWYAGGDAETVILDAPAGLEALIAGFDFEVGMSYLITAAGGTVNYCGFSGPATPELQALFDQAFTG